MINNMLEAASNLEFEEAARLRDDIHRLEAKELGLAAPVARASKRFEPKKRGRR